MSAYRPVKLISLIESDVETWLGSECTEDMLTAACQNICSLLPDGLAWENNARGEGIYYDANSESPIPSEWEDDPSEALSDLISRAFEALDGGDLT